MATIFYFSGSGNSLAIAKKLSGSLGGNIKSIGTCLKETATVENEVIGIVTPVHCMELPPIVKRFLQVVKLNGNPYIFAVATMGAIPGDTLGQAKDILAARGLKLNAGYTLPMPDNSIVFPTPLNLKNEMLAKFDERVETISFDVKAKRDNSDTLGRNPLWQLGNPVGLAVLDNVLDVQNRQVDAVKCINCGTCVKVCPLDLIELVNGLPSFAEGCSRCFACVQWCPVKAIKMGRLSVTDRTQYTNPTLSADELMEYNKK